MYGRVKLGYSVDESASSRTSLPKMNMIRNFIHTTMLTFRTSGGYRKYSVAI